jgi:hypothetical protein
LTLVRRTSIGLRMTMTIAHTPLRWRMSFFGKPVSTFPGHARLRRRRASAPVRA